MDRHHPEEHKPTVEAITNFPNLITHTSYLPRDGIVWVLHILKLCPGTRLRRLQNGDLLFSDNEPGDSLQHWIIETGDLLCLSGGSAAVNTAPAANCMTTWKKKKPPSEKFTGEAMNASTAEYRSKPTRCNG
jgi:hypothetical protein